jgi:hypothetical protein
VNQLKKPDLSAILTVEERSTELYVFLRHRFPELSSGPAAETALELEEAIRAQLDDNAKSVMRENVRLSRELSELRTTVKDYDACVVHNTQLEQRLAAAWGRAGILMVLAAGLSAILTSLLR